MKAFTDLEQSKKLSEILPIESADMCYIKHASSNNPDWRFDNDIPPMILGDVPITEITAETLPCWSLAALLEAIPEYIRKYDGRVFRNYRLNLYRSYYHCCSYSFGSTTTDDDDNILYCVGKENWVDACYEMILKLKENNCL